MLQFHKKPNEELQQGRNCGWPQAILHLHPDMKPQQILQPPFLSQSKAFKNLLSPPHHHKPQQSEKQGEEEQIGLAPSRGGLDDKLRLAGRRHAEPAREAPPPRRHPRRALLVGARQRRRRRGRLDLRHVPRRRLLLIRWPPAHPLRRPPPARHLAASALRHRRGRVLGVPHDAPRGGGGVGGGRRRGRGGGSWGPRACCGGGGGVQGGVLVAAHRRRGPRSLHQHRGVRFVCLSLKSSPKSGCCEWLCQLVLIELIDLDWNRIGNMVWCEKVSENLLFVVISVQIRAPAAGCDGLCRVLFNVCYWLVWFLLHNWMWAWGSIVYFRDLHGQMPTDLGTLAVQSSWMNNHEFVKGHTFLENLDCSMACAVVLYLLRPKIWQHS